MTGTVVPDAMRSASSSCVASLAFQTAGAAAIDARMSARTALSVAALVRWASSIVSHSTIIENAYMSAA